MDASVSSLAFQPFDRVSLLGVTMDRIELGDLRGWLDAALASGQATSGGDGESGLSCHRAQESRTSRVSWRRRIWLSAMASRCNGPPG